jgi:hypothetical protein
MFVALIIARHEEIGRDRVAVDESALPTNARPGQQVGRLVAQALCKGSG